MKIWLAGLLAFAAITVPTVAAADNSPVPAPGSTRLTAQQAPKEIARWKRFEGESFIVWIPNKKWQVVEAPSCCVDVSSPVGDAFASYGFTPVPRPIGHEEALGLLLTTTTDVQILEQGEPFAYNGGTRQVTDFLGVHEQHDVHGVATVDITVGASGYVISGTYKAADVTIWKRSKAKLQLILDHVLYLGRNVNP